MTTTTTSVGERTYADSLNERARTPKVENRRSRNLRSTSAPGAFPEEEMDLLRSAWDRDGATYSMTAQWRASDWPYDGDGRIARPVLVIFAPGDVYFTEEATKLSLRFLDAGELVELDSGTHWVGQEQPERIGGILAGFFGRAH